MGANQTFNVMFKVDGNIDPINGKMQQLSKVFKNIHLPKTLSGEFTSTIEKIEKEFDKFEKLRGKQEVNQKDSNLVNSSYERLLELIKQLNKEWDKIEGVDSDKLIDPDLLKTINQVEKAWKGFKETFESLDTDADGLKELNEQLERQKKLITDLEQIQKNGRTNQQLGAEKGRITQEISRLEQQKKDIAQKRDVVSSSRDTTTLQRRDEVKQLEEQYQSLEQRIQDLIEKKKQLDEQIDTNRNLPQLLKEARDGLQDIEQKIEDTVKAAKSDELDNFKNKLKEILNLSDTEANNLPDTFEDLQKYVNNLKTDQIDKVKAAFPQLRQALSQVDDAAREGKQGVKEFNDELSESKARSQELEHVANQVKQFFSIGNTVQLFKRAIRSAFDTIKELDAVMTQTAVVTDFSVGDMWAQLPEYTKRANELGVSVKGAYEAATLYYQQGLDTNQVMGVSNETLKMAKIAAIDYATATDYMTSALRGFNMEVNEGSAKKVNDIYSQLAAKTAADTEEISIAMSKTAPLAHNAGMEIETTAALLSQMIETTREAPETLGTAMKTVIARFQELKKDPALIEPVEGEIVDANKIEGALRTIGVALRDTNGQFRDLDDVFLEISQKWNSLDTNTQRYIATIAAGSRQQSRFIAMMANYDRTMELVEYANNSAGASQKQFEKTLDSMQSKLDRLKNAWNEFTMGLANNSVIKTIVDLLTDLLNTINKISSGISGNNGILKSLVDISILMGGLKLGKAAFNGFFGWLQGKSKVEGAKAGTGLLKGLFSNLTKKGNNLSSFYKIIGAEGSDLFNSNLERAKAFGMSEESFNSFTKLDKILKGLADPIGTLTRGFNKLKTSITTAGTNILNTLKLIPPQALIVTAGIAAITTAIVILVKQIKANSIEGRIKAAKESTKEAEESANQAKEAYDNLLEGKSQYSELQNVLDNLTYGTQAWKEALIEANGQVLQLLQTFPQLAQYMTSGSDGRLQISTEGWDAVIEQQQEAIRRTTNNLLGAQIYQINLENEKLYKDLQKNTGIIGRNALNELIKQYENNPTFFAKNENGNYSKELENFSEIYAINEDVIYEAQNAIRQYEAAIKSNGAVIDNYVDNLVNNNTKIGELSLDAINTIKDAYNKAYGENYNQKYDYELEKLSAHGGKSEEERGVYSSLDSILDEYGLAVTGTTKKKLQELYKYLAGVTGEQIDQGILDNKDAMREAITRMRLGDQMQEGIDQLTEILATDTSGNIQKVLDVLGGNFEKFSSTELENFGDLANNSMKDFANSMGLSEKELSQLLDSLGYTFDDFTDKFGESVAEMAEQIKQSKIDLVQAMLDSGSFKDSRSITNRLKGLSDQQITSLAGISGQISGLSKETQGSLLQQLPGLYKAGYQTDIENLFKGLDFSDPISSLKSLQEEAENSTTAVGKLAQQIISMEPNLFSAGNLFQNFVKSAEFDDINDDLEDLVKNNGKITSTNIKELAKSSSKLNDILRTGTVSAGALAKAFTAMNAANVPMESFTTKVLEALSVTKTFEEELAEVQDYWANLNPGIDEGSFLSSLTSITDKIEEIAGKGQYGNTALEGYLTSVYGAENLKLSNDYNERKNQVDSIIAQLRQWESGDGLGFIMDAYNKAGEALGFIVEEGGVTLDTMGRTTEQLVSDLATAMGVSEQYAASQLALYSSHSTEFKAALAENDFQAQIEKLVTIDGDQLAVMNESELQAFAVATGQDLEKVRQEVQSKGIKVVDFIDTETGVGAVGDKLVEMIEGQLSEAGKKFNLIEDLDLSKAINIEDGNLLIDIDQITGRLQELGLTAEQINSIFESDSFNNWLENAQSSIQQEARAAGEAVENTLLSKTIEVPVKVVDEQGNEHIEMNSVEVSATTVEGLDAAVNATLEAANYDLVAQSIVNQDFSGLSDNITDIMSSAAQTAANTLRTKINNVTFSNKKVGVTLTYTERNKPAILSIMGYASGTTLNLDTVWNAVNKKTNPSINNTTKRGRTYHVSNSGGRYVEGLASGTKFGGLKHNEVALTGEEGYELAYDSHGAFLLGENGPEITKLEKGTVIYPHDISKKILNHHSASIFPNHKTGTISNYDSGSTVFAGYTNDQWAAVGGYTGAAASNMSSVAASAEKTADAAEKIAEASEDVTEETEKWENSISFIYNLTEKINHETRTRDKLERQYNRLLKTHTATGEELKRITDEEVVSLKKKQQMQKESIELLKKELHAYMMLNKEMMKYAIIDNWDDMTIHVAWNTINSVTDPEEGRRIEEFINRLESTQKEIQDLEDSIEDIEDELIEIKERGKEQYRNLEDRVLDALISEQQEMIDEQEKTIKAIGDAESSLVDAIQKNIDKMRQERENEETESSLAEKERRLAYLRQDTTGSNALEIKKLEDDLAKEKQDYSDSLIDQALKDLKDQNDVAKEQRDKQIEIAQSQLDWQEKTGYWADEATRIVREGIGDRGIMDENSRLYKLLYDQEGVASMSNASQDWWKEQLQDTISEAFVYLKGVIEGQQPEVKQYKDDYMAEMINQMNSGDYAGFAANEKERNEKISAYGMEGQWPSTDMSSQYEKGKKDSIDMSRDYQADINRDVNAGSWSSAFRNAGRRDAKIAKMNNKDLDSVYESYQQVFQKWYAATQSKKYKRGGLADFTGPAWLDGSKSKPEMVLNAKDTQNFIQLKDILAGLRSGIVGNNQEQSGDWYFDIDINVGEIANDYDVDKVADRVKQAIYKETTYRNVNAINFLK